jgi:hypothetical protein
VFFWPTRERLENHLGAKFNRHDFQLVVTVGTAALLSRNSERVGLSPINSGATLRRAAPRGAGTSSPSLSMTSPLGVGPGDLPGRSPKSRSSIASSISQRRSSRWKAGVRPIERTRAAAGRTASNAEGAVSRLRSLATRATLSVLR